MGTEFGKKLKELRESKGETQSDLADILGVKLRQVQRYEDNVIPRAGRILMLNKHYGFNFYNLIADEISHIPVDGDHDKDVESYKDIQEAQLRAITIPFYDADSIGGHEFRADMTAITKPDSTIDVGDLLRDSKLAMRVYGNSMIPGYPPGSVIGMIPKKDILIHPGHVYVIETADERWIKRLYLTDDQETIELHSDNTMVYESGPRVGQYFYPPFTIKKKLVKRLYLVTGVIKRNANTVI